MSFLRTALSVLATQSVITPIALTTHVLLARALTVHDRGLYAVATEFAMVLATVAQLGWPAASIYVLRRRESDSATMAGASLGVAACVSLLAVGVALAFQEPVVHRFFPGADPRVYALAVGLIPLQILGFLFTGIARGVGRFDLHNAYRLALTAATLVAITLAFGFYQRSASAALAAVLAVHAGAATLLLVLVLRQTGFRLGIPLGRLRATLGFGLKTQAQHVLLNLHQRIDIFMIIYLLDRPEAVGLYAVAVGVTNWAQMIPLSIALALFPTVAGLEEGEAGRFVARVCRHSVFWVTATIGVVLPACPFLITLVFGERYAGSVLPLLLLMPATAVLTIYMILARYFTARQRQRVNILTQIVATGTNVVLNLLWIPGYGIGGAAAASLVSYTLQTALVLFFFTRSSGLPWSEVLLLRRSDWTVYSKRLHSWIRTESQE